MLSLRLGLGLGLGSRMTSIGVSDKLKLVDLYQDVRRAPPTKHWLSLYDVSVHSVYIQTVFYGLYLIIKYILSYLCPPEPSKPVANGQSSEVNRWLTGCWTDIAEHCLPKQTSDRRNINRSLPNTWILNLVAIWWQTCELKVSRNKVGKSLLSHNNSGSGDWRGEGGGGSGGGDMLFICWKTPLAIVVV